MTSRPSALALLACVLLAGALPARVHADDFADFRIPDNHMAQWTGTASGSAGWDAHVADAGRMDDGSGQANLSTQFVRLDDSEARSSQWNIRASLGGDRQHERSSIAWGQGFNTQVDEFAARSFGEELEAIWSGRWYPGAAPLFLDDAVTASEEDSRNWSTTSDVEDARYPLLTPAREEDVRSEADWWHTHIVSVALGFGLGRVRNATGVYEARVLEERLRATGALSRPLGREARQRLANLMYAGADITTSHDRPAAIVWAEIERILRDDGALGDSTVTAAGWLRLAEPFIGRFHGMDASLVPASPLARLIGWSVVARLTESTLYQLNRQELAETDRFLEADTLAALHQTGSFERGSSSTDRTLAGLAAEVHRPAGPRVQLDASASVLADVHVHQHGFVEALQASAGWIAADRWLVTASVQQARTLLRGTNAPFLDDNWSVTYGVTAEYFVTDHVDATLQARQSHDKSSARYFGAPSAWEHDRAGGVSFGLTYRFTGFAAIAGLAPLPAN